MYLQEKLFILSERRMHEMIEWRKQINNGEQQEKEEFIFERERATMKKKTT